MQQKMKECVWFRRTLGAKKLGPGAFFSKSLSDIEKIAEKNLEQNYSSAAKTPSDNADTE